MSFILILESLNKGWKKFNIGIPFLIFLLMYLSRMYIDLYINDVYTSTFPSPHTYFIYMLGICFFLSLGISFAKNLDFQFISRWFFIFIFVVIALSIVYNSVLNLDTSSTQRNAGAENIGALTYGHLGVSFFLISLHYFLLSSRLLNKLFFASTMCLGLLVMYLAASRSPLLALVICTIIYLLIYRGAIRGLFVLLLIISPIYFFWGEIIDLLSSFHGSFLLRVMKAVEDGDSSGRDLIYDQGIKQFLDYPIFGGSFILESGSFKGFYPHNLILEVFMATGIVGGILFLSWISKVAKYSYYIILSKNRYAWIPTLFLQYFIFSMSSKSLYTNSSLWYFSFLVIYLYHDSKKIKQQNN